MPIYSLNPASFQTRYVWETHKRQCGMQAGNPDSWEKVSYVNKADKWGYGRD